MADIFTKKKRSEIMSKIRSKETGIERMVFSYLRKEKIYFRKHYDKIKGHPDIAVPGRKLAVFIDGDFWHGWKFERKRHGLPDFWVSKIASNIARDRRNRRRMRRNGWMVLKVWEHQLKNSVKERNLKRIGKFLGKRGK